jgi:general stress protein 26
MSKQQAIEAKFWSALTSDRTVMLGLDGVENGHTRPMTAQVVDDRSPIWFFASRDNSLVNHSGESARAVAAFTSKGHDLFASVRGSLCVDQDRVMIEKLWNPFIAAWFEGGKDDPNLVLLRFDAESTQVWLNANDLLAGIKMLFGADPKRDYQDKVATVELR